MTVKELKELLEEKLDILNEYEDEQKIKQVTNTYFLGGTRYFLGIAGYDGGYIDLHHLEEQIEDLDDYEEEDD